jgi:phosphate transport system permease protein
MTSDVLGRPAVSPVPRQRLLANAATSRRRLAIDRAARWAVTLGGLAIIASILGILLFILAEVLPLMRSARVTVGRSLPVAGASTALLVDEHRTHVAAAGADGIISVVRLEDGKRIARSPLLPAGDAATLAGVAATPDGRGIVAATSDGRVVGAQVTWSVEFDAQGERTTVPLIVPTSVVAIDPQGGPIGTFAARFAEGGGLSVAAQRADGRLVVAREEVSTNEITGETTKRASRREFTAPPLSALVLDAEGHNVFAGTPSGELLWWAAGRESDAPEVASSGVSGVTALALLVGDRSLVVGQADGSVSIWFPIRQADETFRLERVRDFPRLGGAITEFAASPRNRSFFAASRAGDLALLFSTSDRTLWKGRAPGGAATALAFAAKGDGAIAAGAGSIASLAVDNPHPEVSLRALFSRIWYEGYEKPEYVWQSTGGTDDFESKLSLTPLMVGTLKGTLYSLLLAIPLGVFGAMFASQFLHPKLLAWVKPTVEIMASLPSVVLGFLAGLWLAPVLERMFPALISAVIFAPLAVWITGIAWSRLPLALRGRFLSGSELFLYLVVLAATLGGCLAASPLAERLLFGGSFQHWLLETTGLAYDQRNAVVVGLAMGFAVIPIIFAITEDAFSNVPKNLIAGSLALGANRWQTVTRVLLPTASPGIFSAVMIGFGRAIGETMIVLMATGNTPILALNAFNGFRTLSANIAVEIPEAPLGGTLYRTLFLAALMLFVLTFTVNTAAEIVRQRLRRKFAQL